MKSASLFVALAACLILPMAALVAPTITIYTDANTYQSGDTIEVRLSAENDDEAMSVDVYVGTILPDGDIWSAQYDGWSHSIEPWIPDIHVPAWFEMDRTPFWTFDLPCEEPPIEEAGDYSFAALLTYPGTFTYVSTASLAPFTVGASPGSHYYVDRKTGHDQNDGSQGSPWRTITHALESVEGSGSNPVAIHVAASWYGPGTGEAFPLVMKNWVSLVGESAETTILDGEGDASHVIYCDGVSDLTIEGLTITGGNADGRRDEDRCGAGIYCCGNGSPIIQNNTISGNAAGREIVGNGAGIFCTKSSPTIRNNKVIDNSGEGEFTNGGGIYCEGGSPTIDSNMIKDNSAYRGGGVFCEGAFVTIVENTISANWALYAGGGIHCEGSPATIVENVITGNSATYAGGGIECRDYPASIIGNTISDNTARSRGGGIDCEYCSPTIEGNMISRNSADSGAGIHCWGSSPTIRNNTLDGNSACFKGGALSCYYGAPVIENNVLSGNSASKGGGLHFDYTWPFVNENTISNNSAYTCGGGIYWDSSSLSIHNNTIAGNTAQNGGGIYCDWAWASWVRNNLILLNLADQFGGGIYCDSLRLEIHNNTIAGNAAQEGGGIYCGEISPTVYNCIIWANGSDLYDCAVTYCCIVDPDNGEGNIHDDPMFVIGPLGEYYLHPDSPCIDAGSRSAEEARLSDRTTQTDGTPDTKTVDMGYHYPAP